MPKRITSKIVHKPKGVRWFSKYKICVSGAAAGQCLINSRKLAYDVGEEVVRQGAILTTGATTGVPFDAARGAKAAGGIVIGFSPAGSPREHAKKYKLPLEYVDVIIYTGSGYAGRNLLLTRGSDAVITICGRMGTLNEFTVAFEDKKIIGVLRESGGTADEIPHILETAHKDIKAHVIFDHDPKQLVAKVIAAIKKREGNSEQYYGDKK